MKKILNYINGNIQGNSNNFIPIEDPSKGEEIGEVIIANNVDFKNAMNLQKKSI